MSTIEIILMILLCVWMALLIISIKTNMYFKRYMESNLDKYPDYIKSKTVAEHILAEECRKCCEHSEYKKCDKKYECIKSWKEEINRWKNE